VELACRLLVFLIGLGFLAGALGFVAAPGMMEPDFSVAATRIIRSTVVEIVLVALLYAAYRMLSRGSRR